MLPISDFPLLALLLAYTLPLLLAVFQAELNRSPLQLSPITAVLHLWQQPEMKSV